MCYPDSSSSLVTDYKEWSDQLPFMTKNSAEHELFQWFDESIIDQLYAHKDTLKYLYINGGEPFIMPMHWKLLEKLIEWGVASNIHISYNTNCTTYDDSFSDYWKHFKVVTVGCSMDAVGDRNKFIRYPCLLVTIPV
jgi:organic radical activating enzyme